MIDSSFSSGFINDMLLSDAQSGYQLVYTTRHSRIYKTTYKGKLLILKTAYTENVDSETSAALLQREYQILSELDNPFIIRTWGLRNDPQIGQCLILDYVDGVPLDKFLEQKPSHKTRQRIIEELLDAVAYLHTKQIVHKDLKPSNILITNNGEHVKLIDFGFSDTDSQTARNLGCTNRYASPEQLNGGTSDYRSDIYTLGKIIREIEPYRYCLSTSRCLSKDPSCRYNNVSSLTKAIIRHNSLPYALLIIAVLAICLATSMWAGYYIHRTSKNQLKSTTATSTIDTLVIKDTTFIHDTVTVVSIDSAEPVINEIHGWYDKAQQQTMHNLKHLEYDYGQFASIRSLVFSYQMKAIKTHYQSLHPEFTKQIEQDYISELSLRYESIYKISNSYPYFTSDNPEILSAYNETYSRCDSLRAAWDSNPRLVFKTLQ